MSADLAALVASPHFRWRVGLPVQAGGVIDGGGVVVFVSLQGFPTVEDSKGWRSVEHPRDLAPVADDPFFKGWLLHLVREAWGDPTICVQHRGGVSASVDAWLVTTESTPEHHGKGHFSGATEAAALAAALLAAPPKDGGS